MWLSGFFNHVQEIKEETSFRKGRSNGQKENKQESKARQSVFIVYQAKRCNAQRVFSMYQLWSDKAF